MSRYVFMASKLYEHDAQPLIWFILETKRFENNNKNLKKYVAHAFDFSDYSNNFFLIAALMPLLSTNCHHMMWWKLVDDSGMRAKIISQSLLVPIVFTRWTL